jgi:hypothetical protein
MDRDAGVRLSASHAADMAACVLPWNDDGLRLVRDKCEWFVLLGLSAEHRGHSGPSVFFRSFA